MPHSFCRYSKPPPGESFRGWVGAIELQVAGKPENLEPAVRKALADADPNLPVLNVMSFDEQVAHNFNQERLIARLTEAVRRARAHPGLRRAVWRKQRMLSHGEPMRSAFGWRSAPTARMCSV